MSVAFEPFLAVMAEDLDACLLMTEYPEIIPDTCFLMTEDPEIIPGNIHSYDRGS